MIHRATLERKNHKIANTCYDQCSTLAPLMAEKEYGSETMKDFRIIALWRETDKRVPLCIISVLSGMSFRNNEISPAYAK